MSTSSHWKLVPFFSRLINRKILFFSFILWQLAADQKFNDCPPKLLCKTPGVVAPNHLSYTYGDNKTNNSMINESACAWIVTTLFK